MDFDTETYCTRSGRLATRVLLLPDADVSDVENEASSDSEYEAQRQSEHEILVDDCSDNDVPVVSNREASKAVTECRNPRFIPNWSKRSVHKRIRNVEWKGHISAPPENEIDPFEYFCTFFSAELFEHIVKQTNMYAAQQGSRFITDKNEIEQYIGVLLRMGIVRMPSLPMYWSQEMRYGPVADVISRNRFREIHRFLHFSDNNLAVTNRDDPNYDRYYKVRPVLESLRSACLQLEPEEKMSVDEQIIPFKGRSVMRQYVPKKPNKWGFKVISRCGVSGLTYDFLLYDGNAPKLSEISCGYQSGDFVIKLCETLPKGMNFKIFF
jgi:hypothetical protein